MMPYLSRGEHTANVEYRPMNTGQNAYVYAIAVDGVVRYIGKGSGIPMKRANEHIRTARRILKSQEAGEKVSLPLRLYRPLVSALKLGAHASAELVIDGLTHEQAFEREVAEIANVPRGQLWNVSPGGLGAAVVTAETRRRQSEAQLAKLATPEARAQRAFRLNAITPEQRALAQAKSTVAKQSPAFKANMAAKARHRFLNKPGLAAVVLRNLEGGRKGHSPETSAKIWSRPETRQNFAEKIRAKWADPEWKAAQIARLKASWNTPEGKAKTRKAIEARWAKKRKAVA